ncbi:MAG TPA: phosphatidate cytidylyltransferase [Acidimicrobiales bacterium]|nr:phosphatidate cytidylyltransferase [Acidimicrobiales bacterium]
MDREDELSQPPHTPGEGIRIIGAEEAAAALEAGQAAGRKPSDAPRFGDVPPAPTGPRPAMRFPLESDESDELSSPVGVGGTRVNPPESERPAPPTGADDVVPLSAAELPHWTEPATGEVPRILASGAEEEPEDPAWSSFTRAPRWRDQGGDWDEAEFGDASVLGDDETRIGALDTSRTEHSDLFSFDEPDVPAPPPTRIRTRNDPPDEPTHAGGGGHTGGRDNVTAIVIGAAMGFLFLLFAKLGPKFLFALSTLVVLLCATEVFAVLRRAGYRPVTLLGVAGTLSLSIAAYWKGEAALPLIMTLVIVFSMLWYLWGVIRARPTVNIAVTLLGFAWSGFLGSYAALLLRPGAHPGHPRYGVALLVAAVLCTVANDVGAYAFGRTFGHTPLAPSISPNKTLEGLLGGTLCTVLVGAGLVSRMHPFTVAKGFWFAVLAVALVAPLGDLCESMIKRDIGLKDMGSLLPGHGGVFDRFDAMLFVLPATYYWSQYLKIGR